MKIIEIEGGRKLNGTIRISGAKNATVALIPAAILTDEEATICNVPEITDTEALCDILKLLKVKVNRSTESVVINPTEMENVEIEEQYSKKLRASYYFMASLLGKYKHVEMYFPGGCTIGERPIDQTLKAYKALGATVTIEDNRYIVDAKELKGTKIYLDMPSVGATINTILASVKAKGKTVIENAAKEPEIVNVATFLNTMGAKIKGAGTNIITITGVNYLHKSFHEVIPDRIEAGTYVIIGSLLGDNLKIKNWDKLSKEAKGRYIKEFAKISFYILLPFILVAKEPDLGTALILFLTGFAVLFVIGVDKKIWLTIVLAVGLASPIIYESLHDYQKKRITDFISEEPSYQVKQAIIAIGNGGIYGKSKDEATQTHFKFLPISTSDFIFAYLIERFGFAGALFVMSLYMLLIMHLLSLNFHFKEDPLLRVFATSVADRKSVV